MNYLVENEIILVDLSLCVWVFYYRKLRQLQRNLCIEYRGFCLSTWALARWIHIKTVAQFMSANMNTIHVIWLAMVHLPLCSKAVIERYTPLYRFICHVHTSINQSIKIFLWNKNKQTNLTVSKYKKRTWICVFHKRMYYINRCEVIRAQSECKIHLVKENNTQRKCGEVANTDIVI